MPLCTLLPRGVALSWLALLLIPLALQCAARSAAAQSGSVTQTTHTHSARGALRAAGTHRRRRSASPNPSPPPRRHHTRRPKPSPPLPKPSPPLPRPDPSPANATDGIYGTWQSGGKATFYGGPDARGTWAGNCGYGDLRNTPMGTSIAAAPPPVFADGLGCGQCYQIRCAGSPFCIQGATADVTITDKCPECEATHFDLTQPVFTSISQVQAGIIGLEYRRIPCTYTTNIALVPTGHVYWFSMLVRNVGGPGDITAVQVKRATDTAWIPMTHDWGANWVFNPNGDLKSALSFRLTTRLGNAVIELDNCIPANPAMNALYTCDKQVSIPF